MATRPSNPRSSGRPANPRNRYFRNVAYKPNDPNRRFSGGTGLYTPWPGRAGKAGYGWKISGPPWPIPVPGSAGDTGDWLGAGLWVYAPGDSHMHSFGFIDARKDVGHIRGDSLHYSEWRSVLVAKFRKNGVEYAFCSKDHDRLEFIYLTMVDAESPGEVVWSHLICEMVEYWQL